MTDTTYICGSCQSKLEICDKEDGVIIVYQCKYCDEQAAIIARMLNGKMETMIINRKVRLPDLGKFAAEDDAFLCEAINKMGR